MPSFARASAASRPREHHARIGDQRDVLAGPLDVRHAERDHVVLLGHRALDAVQHLVLDEHDRVIVADRGLEQALRIVGRGGHDDVNAREMRPQRFEALRMVRGDGTTCATFGPDHHRDAGLAAEHVAVLGALVRDLIHGQRREVDIHDLGDGAHARHCRADRRAADRGLADRGIDDPVAAELGEQAARRAISAAVKAHILTHDEDGRVSLHLFARCLDECIGIGDRLHRRRRRLALLGEMDLRSQLRLSLDVGRRVLQWRDRRPSPVRSHRARATPRRTPSRGPAWPRRRARPPRSRHSAPSSGRRAGP